LRASLLIICMLLVTTIGHAQSAEDLKRLTLEELTQIDVTSTSRVPTTVWQTPAAVYVITQEDIRRSGATSLAEVLRLAPGVDVSRIDSGHWAIGIRGFANQFSKSVLVLIDGRSVYTPLFAGVYWQVQDTVLEDIDRIEVIRGSGGTVWGSNAVNGVINIITKSARDTTGLLVSALGGAVDRAIVEARAGSTTANGAFRVYGKGFSRGPEDHATGPDFDTWWEGQAGFRADWTRGDRDSFTVQGDGYRTANGTQVQIASFTPPLSTIVNDTVTFTGANVLARWKRQFSTASDITFQVYWDHAGQSGPQADDVRDTIDLDFVQQLPLPHNHLVYGAGARISPDRFTQVVATTNFTPANLTYSLYSAFAQDEIALAKHLALTLGSKFEHNSYTGLEVQPTARLLWNQPDRQSAWVAITRAVRSPSRIDRDFSLYLLARATPPIYANVVGSSSFISETLLGTEAGYRVLAGSRLFVDVAAFHNRYDGLVGLGNTTLSTVPAVPVRIVGTLPWTNAVDGTTDGIEIAPDWRPSAWWQLRGSYSYLHLDLQTRAGLSDVTSERTYMGSSPHHQIVATSQFTLPHALQFDQTYRHVSELPAQLVPAYDTADVRLAWHATRSVELSVVAQNLVDPSHPEFGTLPGGLVGIRRTAYAQVRWVR
jgi:iron complex outermembrane receptor protein